MKKDGLITEAFVNTFIKKRKQDIHKGDCGKILIVAGSVGMAGAAVLCARAALRTGAGLVRVSIPEALFPILQIGVPEATCIPRERLLEDLTQYSAIAVGPGLGVEKQSGILIRNILEMTDKPVLLDADGLNLLRGDLDVIKKAKADIIITPHPGEAAKLLGRKTAEINRDRLQSARELAAAAGAVTVLKGAGSVVATPDGETYINTTGNPGMATAGSGDVLSGVIAALLGQGLSSEAAAIAGVYLHGLAGDMAKDFMGEYGLIASDIASMMALAIKRTLDDLESLEK
ncbi:MAG: NAD(P)H-hydrate dehydratase [Eubacteriales bacterium]|nr:NAD(P)H-hydrate dehydratase [Eubacteriales bacterium]MDD3198693.1 NAD(P)H-hydrate dehydratase [Eubacteriales bacterium]MDD4121701.1 NAD(P)H-hydrate dehydratase [Eubacteriales bacterium]MDD4629061.1 NAD(P)H-hydrate dehydratase [Eubacteriales bacterium]